MRILQALMTWLLIGLLAGTVASADQGKVETLTQEGFDLIDQQRFEQAIKKFEKAIKSGGSFEPHLGIAAACNRIGDHGKALQHAEQAVAMATTGLEKTISNFHLGIASFDHLRMEQGREVAARGFRRGELESEPLAPRDWTTAEQAFRIVLELDAARYSIAHLNLAQVLGYQRRYQEAVEELQQWERSDPPPPPSHIVQAIENLRCSAAVARGNPGGRMLTVGADDSGVTKPRKISDVAPRYTESAMLKETQGLVVVEGVIDRTGKVACANVLAGLPNGLTESALDAVSQWTFDPALLAGEPVAVVYQLTVSFRLSKKRKLSDLVVDG